MKILSKKSLANLYDSYAEFILQQIKLPPKDSHEKDLNYLFIAIAHHMHNQASPLQGYNLPLQKLRELPFHIPQSCHIDGGCD